MTRIIDVHPSRAVLVEETATALAALLRERIEQAGRATVAVTGGSVGIELLAALVDAAAAAELDWTRVVVTWSDERFVAADSEERNAVQARAALLEHVPIPAANVHELPAVDGEDGEDLDAAAERASRMLAELGAIDVTLLGMGPDAHIASLFPGLPGIQERGERVIAVRDAPKPPPARLSFTLDAINASARVWLIVAGDDKAAAVALALTSATAAEVPASAPRGRAETRILVDEAAASMLPDGLRTQG